VVDLMNIMMYYMTYEISLALIYNCILNLVNKTGFQVGSESRLQSQTICLLGLAQKWNHTELKKSTWIATFPIPSDTLSIKILTTAKWIWT